MKLRKLTTDLLKHGDYVALASGVGFTVQENLSVPNPNGKGYFQKLTLLRKDKNSGREQTTELLLTEGGYFISPLEPSVYDLVSVMTHPSRTVYTTPAGMVADLEHIDLVLDLPKLLNERDELLKNRSVKVQTRNGFWFNLKSVGEKTPDGFFLVTLGQIGAVCVDRTILYTQQGRTQRTVQSATVGFDAYDIVALRIIQDEN